MRRVAGLALAVLLAGAPVSATPPNVITKAVYTEPTTRYDHGILGDAVEWGALVLTVDFCEGCEGRDIRKVTIRLPQNRVFEDLAPRIIPDEDGLTHVMVVETDLALGARLAIYDESGLVAATPFIGRPHRWLAPVGAADLDGDGRVEVAYVEKPHLSRELKVWRFAGGELTFVAALGGLTNHRIGEDFISGGMRDCGNGPEMVTANGDWSTVMAVRLADGRLVAEPQSQPADQNGFQRVLACQR